SEWFDSSLRRFLTLQITCHRLRAVTLAQLALMNNIRIEIPAYPYSFDPVARFVIKRGLHTKLRIHKYTQDNAFQLLSALDVHLCNLKHADLYATTTGVSNNDQMIIAILNWSLQQPKSIKLNLRLNLDFEISPVLLAAIRCQ